MLAIKKQQKISLKILFLSVVYLVVCGFIFLSIARVVIDLIFDGKVNLTREVIIDIIVVSIITGTAGGLGSWIFAKIDERKSRKSSRSDTE